MELIHGNTPRIDLKALNADARWELAQSLDTHPEILGHLVHDPDEEVRATVASHPELREPYQWTLAEDTSQLVRAVLARAPGTPLEVLVHLASVEEAESVLIEVIENPRTPLEDLRRMQQRLCA